MDDDGGLGIRNWGYYEQSLKVNLGLQLMSSVAKRDQKLMLSARDSAMMVNGGFVHRECRMPEPFMPMDFVRDTWIAQRDKYLNSFPMNQKNYLVLAEGFGGYAMQMQKLPDISQDERALQIEESNSKREGPLKKWANGCACKPSKAKKSKQIPKDESNSFSDQVGLRSDQAMHISYRSKSGDLYSVPDRIEFGSGH
ncbi:protein BASIC PENTACYSTEINE2-like [Magnolia sinica]|uniref:protein BASIC PENTACYSTEINE2-like n=1 Tax=Magnolia sinica TaxID=86752 RepID=UPI00265A4F5B|nr:protein BASIC PENTACYSTEINE2-like [Magnolia sinica]